MKTESRSKHRETNLNSNLKSLEIKKKQIIDQQPKDAKPSTVGGPGV